MLTSGEFFPPTQYQAARAVTLCLDASGNVALSSMANGIVTGVPNFTSGTLDYYTGPTVIPYVTSGMIPYGDEWVIYTSDGVFAYTPSMSGNTASGWFWEAPGNQPASTPIAVLPGFTLDASSGLLAWGNTYIVTGAPPYTTMFSGASGIYVATPDSLYTSGNMLVSGVATSGVFASLASGLTPWLLGSGSAFQIDFTSPTSGTVLASPIPFTATCMAASGSELVVAGVGPLNLGSGAYALAVGVSGTAMVAFPGSGMAVSWVIGGSIENPTWTKLATTSGLPTYSSGISAIWPPVGNTIVLSDYGLGNWTSYLYTGGTLTFQTSGAIAGAARGIAVTENSQFVGIPTPGSSGVYIIEYIGATWAGIGETMAGSFPDCMAIAGIGPTTFAVGSSGQVALMTYAGTAWTSGSAIPINSTPTAAFYDPVLAHVLWASNSGGFYSTQWSALNYGLVSSGVWSSTSGMVLGIVSQRYQALVLTNDSYNMTGLGPNGNSINYWTQPATGLTCLATPVPADYTFPIGTMTGVLFQNLNGPYSIELLKSGQYGTIASGGAALANLTMLGEGVLPSALGYSYDGTLLLATTRGALGPLSSGASGLNYMMASGGFSDMLVASGQTWLSTTVQGSLVSVSGL